MALQFFASYKHKCWKERNIKVGGGGGGAIPQYRKKNRKNRNHGVENRRISDIAHDDRLRLFQVVSISRVCLSKACMYQQSTSAF